MPSYMPEGNTPKPEDNEMRSLQKIVDLEGGAGTGGGGGDAPANATFITQTPNALLSNEQALSTLATGLLKNTTGTGVLSIAVAGTDFSTGTGTVNTIPLWTGVGTLGDSLLIQEAANTVGQRNGVNAQILRVYKTFSDAANYGRARIDWSGADLIIGTQQAGTDVVNLRGLRLMSQTGDITFESGAQAYWSMVTSATGFLLPGQDNVQEIGAASLRVKAIHIGPSSLHVWGNGGVTTTTTLGSATMSFGAGGGVALDTTISRNAAGFFGVTNGFRVGDGTLAAPAYSFSNSTGTGYWLDANGIEVSRSGSQIGRWGGLGLVLGNDWSFGESTPNTNFLYIKGSTTTAAVGEHSAVFMEMDANPSGAPAGTYAAMHIHQYTTAANAQNFSHISTIASETKHFGTGTVTTGVGIVGAFNRRNNAGPVTTGIGVQGNVTQDDNVNLLTNAVCFDAIASASGNITSVFGFRYNSSGFASGTQTNHYAFYAPDMSVLTGTTRWGYYSAGGNNRFTGKLVMGGNSIDAPAHGQIEIDSNASPGGIAIHVGNPSGGDAAYGFFGKNGNAEIGIRTLKTGAGSARDLMLDSNSGYVALYNDAVRKCWFHFTDDGVLTLFNNARNGFTRLSYGNLAYQAVGTGTPEGAVSAPIGSLFMRTNGGSGTSLYIKESGAGNTGWVAVQSAGGAAAGASGDIQYNNGSGGFAAEAAFNYNSGTNVLSLGDGTNFARLKCNGAGVLEQVDSATTQILRVYNTTTDNVYGQLAWNTTSGGSGGPLSPSLQISVNHDNAATDRGIVLRSQSSGSIEFWPHGLPFIWITGNTTPTPDEAYIAIDEGGHQGSEAVQAASIRRIGKYSATLNFGTLATGMEDLTITGCRGVKDGDVCVVTPFKAAIVGSTSFTAWVSTDSTAGNADGVITVRAKGATTDNPGSATFTVMVYRVA